MKTGLTISVIGHAAVLLWSVVTFGVKPFAQAPIESLPVDIISAAEFSQMTAGSKTAPKTAPPKALVEKVAEPKAVDNPAQKVVEKPEIVTASAFAEEKPKPPEPKPEVKPQAKPEPKPKDAEKKPDSKPDPIAEALKKDESKKPEPKKEAAKPEPQKTPPQPQPKFDPKAIEQRLALLDKRDGQRRAATGETLNQVPGLGTSTGRAAQLSQNEIDALRARLRDCWNLPAGAADAKDLNVEVRILLKQDGSLSADPRVLNRSSNPFFQIAAESALRAVRTCAPFSFLPVAKYEAWKDIEINFNPEFMFRG
jgi:outer membrane biosynthesis protein TonB